MKEAGKQTRSKGMVCRRGQMETGMRASGKTSDMEKGHIFTLTGRREKQSIRMGLASDGHQPDLISISCLIMLGLHKFINSIIARVLIVEALQGQVVAIVS